jgi:hypothetical protein
VRASALLGLGQLAKAGSAGAGHLERFLAEGEQALVRLAAAMAVTSVAGPAAPRGAIEALCDAIVHRELLDSIEQEWWPWGAEIGEYLLGVGPTHARYAASLLLDGLRNAPDEQAVMLLISTLDTQFELVVGSTRTLSKLTEDQRNLLIALLQMDRLWEREGQTLPTLATYGLPISRDRLRQLVASSAAQPN